MVLVTLRRFYQSGFHSGYENQNRNTGSQIPAKRRSGILADPGLVKILKNVRKRDRPDSIVAQEPQVLEEAMPGGPVSGSPASPMLRSVPMPLPRAGALKPPDERRNVDSVRKAGLTPEVRLPELGE